MGIESGEIIQYLNDEGDEVSPEEATFRMVAIYRNGKLVSESLETVDSKARKVVSEE